MRVYSTYECEICLTTYNSEEKAAACEASGFPEPLPFLAWDRPIPAFGANGVTYVVLQEVRIERAYTVHEWSVKCDTLLKVESHIRGSYLPARLFDPRYGWDIFRHKCSVTDLRIWLETMTSYGFTEADADSYTRVTVDRERRKFAEIRENRDALTALNTPVQQISFTEHEIGLIPVSSLVRRKTDPTEVTG